MASAARQANFIEENVQYADDIKPSLQQTDSSHHSFLYPAYSALSPSEGQPEPSPVKYEAVAPAHQAEQENSAVEYEPHVKYEPCDNYPHLAFTPSSSSPVDSTSSHQTNRQHVTPSTESFPCPPAHPSQVQLPPLVNPRPEHPQSAWLYQPTCEQNRSPPAEVFYERERGALPHCLRLNHRSSSHAHRLSGPYATYTPEYGYPAVSDYHTLDEFGYNECRPNPRRILYPQAIYPGNGASPYSRPMAHSAMPAERPFLCEKCGARFNRNHDLKRHTRIHLEVKPFPCGWCEKAFSRKDALKRHLMVKACSGSKEVSVEESIRRAEQVRQRKFESPSPSSATST
ncbi:hypothetical protein MJO28_010406 [Puccinia striiformis f. sp. tritici]|uniref:C2H2-type domain-containing protein n=4 Tax=Puccinia striiformis TaxID=27350 RepID=A0A0L0V9N4_9BASI|nr:hypothetical protein Pst134EA_019202 [Puccinia striiformis f. sp. tritici]KAI9623799.1 hypothetical protein KEM48_009338 [Puccinia striiformis f. sp. tritici PST-130]KNE95916.1 hypothetical protein PSTG_10834 [Puccinia striiformis f. sp. tritici PST-78]POW01944.1 hypothetical protein PSTT_12146 [Puccinia striiformis]KAH9449295.1 hypothetical protein Pst134EB_020120 [Puccinia striiformis f. sp. tritici]KAH9459051.1 hypothetical protein Pst134EA_019202 [Puccinia striiformis f. sp. tritici]